jgi:SNF2 family DNA or RNA helicase
LRLALYHRQDRLGLKPAASILLSGLPIALEGNPVLLEAMASWEQPSVRSLPGEFQGTLREYQHFGYQWLVQRAEASIGAILADDMGLGKTVQALAVLVQRQALGPALVVAPASVLFNWGEECSRFAPSLLQVHLNQAGKARRSTSFLPGQLVLVSYAMLLKDVDFLSRVEWGTLVLDEAQFAKNAWSKTARALARIPRAWTLALTGTPLENHLGDLWSIFRLIQPEVLGEWSHFRRRFLDPMRTWNSQRQMEMLRSLIRPFMLRREKNQVSLPERQDVLLKVTMELPQRRRYEEERQRVLQQLEEGGGQLGFRVLAGITRLRQLACHPLLLEPRYRGDSAKLQIFRDLASGLIAEGHHLLVFSQFTEFLDLLAREMDRMGFGYLMMTGQTPVAQRAELISRFQQGTTPIFLVSLRAGGTGLNLTRADYVFLMDPWWNPAVEAQATDRAHRLGQTRSVTVYRFIVEDTIEEAVASVHDGKRQLLENAVGNLAPLSGDQVAEWIRLLQSPRGLS